MEFWLRAATIDKHEYHKNEMPLDLSDAFFEELLFHKSNNNECWKRIEWCFDNKIPFTIRAYEVFSDTQHETVENKKDYTWAVEETINIPATIPDLYVWFLNIPNNNHSMMYRLSWNK